MTDSVKRPNDVNLVVKAVTSTADVAKISPYLTLKVWGFNLGKNPNHGEEILIIGDL